MAYRKIEDSKLSAVADKIRSRLNDTQSIKVDEMPALIDDIGIGRITDYWRSYLATKATEINTALNAAGENKSAFLWYTDAHWAINYGTSPVLLKYLSKNTGMRKTFYGGDISNAKTGEIESLTAWQSLVSSIPNHHSVIGNHDNQVSELPTVADKGAFFFTPERTGDVVLGTNATNGNTYYYIDNHIENTRYICLSTGRMWTVKDEQEWCVEVLKSTPENWHIIVISHLWLDTSSGAIITTPPDYVQSYLDMFDAYNYRQSGTTSVNSVAYDFAAGQAKIECIIGGHVHQDYDFTTETGIPVILTECDCWEERGASVATQGTITENCVYAVIADYATKKVNIINVGRGSTRSVTIPDVVHYTNWAKKAYAKGSTTEIYNNGQGYKVDTRVGSSGDDTTGTGWVSTGYIPATRGSVVRLKNVTVMNMSGITGTNRCRPLYYDADFAYLSEGSAWSLDKTPPISTAFSPVYGENGDVVQFTIPSSVSSSMAYLRLTVDDINENSIITVNEEID